MRQFLLPLGIFVVGMILLAISTIFYPDINNAATALQAETENISSNFWAFDWAVGNTRFVLFITGFFCVVISAGWAWLKRR